MEFRVGQGYDIHPLVPDRKFILGGVEIDFYKGLAGHSDGDALCHAIADAILGAAGLGDIGHYFPDDDESVRGISSLTILAEVIEGIKRRLWKVSNVDATVILQSPKLAPYAPEMKEKLANTMRISTDAVNIKAKTGENMGDVGRGDAIEVHAIALLTR